MRRLSPGDVVELEQDTSLYSADLSGEKHALEYTIFCRRAQKGDLFLFLCPDTDEFVDYLIFLDLKESEIVAGARYEIRGSL